MSSPSNDSGAALPQAQAGREVAVTRDCGYHSRSYAAAFGAVGRAEPFGMTGGHVLVRRIADSDRHDLTGPYPILACTDWDALGSALEAPPGDPVSLTVVTDPFCPLTAQRLAGLFDLCRPFHDHWLIDLAAPLTPSRHHRRMLRQAGRSRIKVGHADSALVSRFVALYAHLTDRKGISDLRAFPADSLEAQLAVPGALLVTAWEGEALLGADLYYHEGRIVRAHLSAYAPEGYARSVSYPMMAAAVDHFRTLAEFIDLGGAQAVGGEGVGHFKRGWTALSQPSHICGRIFDPVAYDTLSVGRRSGWFPAYRAGEYAGPV